MAASAHRTYGPPLATLRKRREFLRLRGGARWSGKAFVLEGKKRVEGMAPGIRFGFTISKKVGLAHERNRMRRRLSHALRATPLPAALADWDCVIVARRPALDVPFDVLVGDFTIALARLADPRSSKDPRSVPAKAAPRKERRSIEP